MRMPSLGVDTVTDLHADHRDCMVSTCCVRAGDHVELNEGLTNPREVLRVMPISPTVASAAYALGLRDVRASSLLYSEALSHLRKLAVIAYASLLEDSAPQDDARVTPHRPLTVTSVRLRTRWAIRDLWACSLLHSETYPHFRISKVR